MFIPISSFNNNPVSSSASGRLTPIARGSAVAFRSGGSSRDTETIIHLSDQAKAILAGLDPVDVTSRRQAPQEVTIVPVPADDAAVQGAEFEPIFGATPSDDSDDAEAQPFEQAHTTVEPREGGAAAQRPGQKPRTPEQERSLQELRARDVEVRAHEAAHAAVAGSLGGTPSLEYVVGPDGKRYAVGGEVSVDTSPGRTPEETITKARTIRAAATAPASPSAQDMAVAAAAARMESEAQSAIRERHTVESRGGTDRADRGDEIRRVDWSQIGQTGKTGKTGPVNNNGQTGKAAGAAASSVTEAATAPATSASRAVPDPEMMMLQLVREQQVSRGGMGHSHLASGCGFCRRSAATYASV